MEITVLSTRVDTILSEIYERKTIKLSGSSAVILPIGWVRKQKHKFGIKNNEELLLTIETRENDVLITPTKKEETHVNDNKKRD